MTFENSLILGGLAFGSKLNKKETFDFLNFAYDLGIKDVDSGSLYGNNNSQKFISEFQISKKKFFNLHTKIGLKRIERNDGSFGVKLEELNPNYIIKSITEISKIFKSKSIHRVSLHSFCKKVKVKDQVEAIEMLIKNKVIDSYGICNFEPEELKYWIEECNLYKLTLPSSLDVHFNLFEQRALKEIFPLLIKNEIKAIPYRVFCRGILANRYENIRDLPKSSRAYSSWRVKRYLNEENLKSLKNLELFLKEKDTDLITYVLAWTFSFECIQKICIGTSSRKQLIEIFNSFEKINSIKKNIFKEFNVNKLPSGFLTQPELFFET